MNKSLIEKLSIISQEELRILDGVHMVDKDLYAHSSSFVIDCNLLLNKGELIYIRLNTRFIHFPEHKHNYVEVVYMVQGTTTHIVNGDTIILEEGELLFLNQNSIHENLPAERDDIAVNFVILPEFFDKAFKMLNMESNFLKDFLQTCLNRKNGEAQYLHFKVNKIQPIRNLAENMIWSLVNNQLSQHSIIQTTMGLLLLELSNYMELVDMKDEDYDNKLLFKILNYIEKNYSTAALQDLADEYNCKLYWLSKEIKKLTGKTFKQLLQEKRINQSCYYLENTNIPITEISNLVGYSNTSYFYRIFNNTFSISPKEYRQAHNCK